jgi:hypothetical protein
VKRRAPPRLASLLILASLSILASGLLVARESGGVSPERVAPEPDSLRALTERLCALAPPAARLARAYLGPAESPGAPAPRAEPALGRRRSALAAELERVCRLYRTEGERLFLGQEVSAIYRRRRAVERALARTALPPDLKGEWEVLQPALARLHQAVDWRAFNAWYLERDGDSD